MDASGVSPYLHCAVENTMMNRGEVTVGNAEKILICSQMTDLFGNSDSEEESFVAPKRRRTLEDPAVASHIGVAEQSTVTAPPSQQQASPVQLSSESTDVPRSEVCTGFIDFRKIRYGNNICMLEKNLSFSYIHIYKNVSYIICIMVEFLIKLKFRNI